MNTVTELHTHALSLSKTYRESEAALLLVLVQMQKTHAFYALGYTGLWNYCTQALQLSESSASYFCKVARKGIEVPALVQAVQEGELSLSKARRIEPVVTQDNIIEWVTKAQQLPQRELEREVTKVNPRATTQERITPVAPERSALKVGISTALEAKLRRLKDLLGKDLEAILEEAADTLLLKHDPEAKALRAKPSSRKAVTPPTPGRHPIPAHINHSYIKKHGYRCHICKTARHLHFHHITPVHRGGLNTLDNLQLLCSAHHRIAHLLSLDARNRNDVPSQHQLLTK